MQNQVPDPGPAALVGPDLAFCDREPIHIPGAIQPHGVLLALDAASLAIQQVAGDTACMIGARCRRAVGAPGRRLWLDAREAALLRDLGRAASLLGRPMHAFDVTFPRSARCAEASLHRSGGSLVVELEAPVADDPHDPLAIVQTMLQRLHDAPDLPAFCQAAVDEIQAFTGFDRVMLYRFLPDGSGAVDAEARAPGVSSFSASASRPPTSRARRGRFTRATGSG